MRNIVSLLLLFILLNVPGFAQQDTIFRSLTATQTDEGVLINFTLRGGVTCSGVKIERSPDGKAFFEVYEIAGVCGSIATDEAYSFTDKDPFKNSISFYRLDLGSLDLYSEIVSVRFIDYGPQGVTFFPNPCSENCTVYFSNSNNQELELILVNRLGMTVLQEVVTGNSWKIPATGLNAGMYFLKIYRNNEEKFSGKLMIF